MHRADAELAAARTQMILAEQNAAVAKATLAELLGLAGTEVDIAPGSLLDSPQQIAVSEVPASSHPLALVQQDRVAEAKARANILSHSYVPTFDIQAVGYGRGTGVNGDGKPATDPQQGLLPDTVNWGVGFTVKFAIFDFASIHSREKIEQANQRREEQLYGQTLQTVTGEAARAQAALDARSGLRKILRSNCRLLRIRKDRRGRDSRLDWQRWSM